jgi:hypothetical protein
MARIITSDNKYRFVTYRLYINYTVLPLIFAAGGVYDFRIF